MRNYKDIIKENLNNEEFIHELCFNEYTNEFEKLVIDKQEYYFIDFINTEKITDFQFEVLDSFSFTTIPTKNYHWEYFNRMMFYVNQLNYGIELCDISDEGDLESSLESRIEIGSIENEDERSEVIELFKLALNNFMYAVEGVEQDIKDGEFAPTLLQGLISN